MNEKIRVAESKRVRAVAELMKVIEEVYPLGSEVIVNLGRAVVVGEVIGYGKDWHDPATVRIRNKETGKVREFCATTKNAP